MADHLYQLGDFQDLVSDWLWGTDKNNILCFSNGRLENSIPASHGVLLGRTILSIIGDLSSVSNYDADIAIDTLDQLIIKRQEFSGVSIDFLNADNRKARLILDGRPLVNAAGEFQGCRGVGRIGYDGNERNEENPQLSTLLLAAENAPNGVVITDEKGVICYTNPSSAKITGFSRTESYGQTPRIFRSGYTSITVYSKLWNTLLQGKTWTGTVYNKHKDGDFFWCREVVSPVLRKDGTISNFVATQEDVTFELIAQEQLKRSEERFKEFAESASDWYWETDAELRYTYISESALDHADVEIEEMMGRKRSEMIRNVEDHSAWHEHLMDLQAERPFKHFTYSFFRMDGQKRRWQISGDPHYSSSGDFLGYRGVGRDITVRTELEEKLQQSQKMEVVGNQAGGIAHDFNNLLGIILGNAELLSEEYEASGVEKSENLENILYATRRGINLTNQLLVFSRKQNLKLVVTCLGSQLKQMMNILKSSMGDTIDIQADIAEDLWCCNVDIDQFVNSVLNMCLNSRDAMKCFGTLKITLHNETLETDYIEKNIPQGDYVVLTIGDDGEGIDGNMLEKVFEPFYSTKDAGQGTGLGLSMVYGFVKKSGGAIWVDSTVGIGTDIHLYLPRYEIQTDNRLDKVAEASL